MSDDSKGLPMTAKWDPDKLAQEIAQLEELERKPLGEKVAGYVKRSGPGLLQSAMTLGAGSAAASVVAGASFGYKLLWVQPLAMFLGVCMLAALSNVVLTRQERPYQAFQKQLGWGWPLVVLWALGTLMASVIWHVPQYGLAASAVRDMAVMANMATDAEVLKVQGANPLENSYLIKAFPAPVSHPETFTAEELAKKETQHKENALKIAQAAANGILDANRKELTRPDIILAGEGGTMLSTAGDGLMGARITLVTDAAQWNTAVENAKASNNKPTTFFTGPGRWMSYLTGAIILCINIIVVWSYGSSRRGVATYEWFLRLLIALVILSFGLVVLCNLGNLKWGEMFRGFLGLDAGQVLTEPKNIVLVLGMLGAAVGINMTFLYPYSLLAKGWGPHHRAVAKWDLGLTMFLPFSIVTSLIMIGMTVGGVYAGDMLRSGMQPVEASKVLVDIVGPVGRLIFDLGLIGMACGAISAHMVVCGFTLPEMLGLKYTKWTFRLCALLPTVGVMGVVTSLPFWFPIAASAVCFTMLPIAYLIFIIMNNKRSYIGDAVGHGWKRVVFNCILIVGLLMATTGAVITVDQRVISVVSPKFSNTLFEKTGGYLGKPLPVVKAEK